MARWVTYGSLGVLFIAAGHGAYADEEARVSVDEALAAARRAAPELSVARARESVANAEVGIAGLYPNPVVAAGTSSEAALISGTVSIPLVILGQRGAATRAAHAEATTAKLDTSVAWNDIRQATFKAYVALWLAEGIAVARRDAAALEATLESAVAQRVQLGAAPELDGLRVHSERLRFDADLLDADTQVTVAGTVLGHWMGATDGRPFRPRGDVALPEQAPPLGELLARLESATPVQRERSGVHAADLRAQRERALVRPLMTLDLGLDALDPTLGNGHATNYRAQLAVEVPLFNQRGPHVDRELAMADVATARLRAAYAQGAAELTAAYRTFAAATTRHRVLVEAVVPAAQSAASATQEAYTLGRAPLVAVLDAQRALIETRLSALEAQAARGNAWADVQHAVGAP